MLGAPILVLRGGARPREEGESEAEHGGVAGFLEGVSEVERRFAGDDLRGPGFHAARLRGPRLHDLARRAQNAGSGVQESGRSFLRLPRKLPGSATRART